ncbi:hypothetical protein A5747_13680 [Mycobacterium sp. IS-836]|uniref:hypothetical protein n=1 Tax=Mycobacterium sp. IS-836 TaxID=1834160 RepID=UPI00096DAF45|nr:hypothetical protein [Mycobacterium sp. IS-836]OMC55434.1 hypothetical protein A5747_13680 [Mycobacterium sp. IS-836]
MSQANSTSTTVSGVGVLPLLGVLFVGLKLGHVVNWPWLWVLLPFWGGLALSAAIIVVCAVIIGIVHLLED